MSPCGRVRLGERGLFPARFAQAALVLRPRILRYVNRGWGLPEVRSSNGGFRLARTITP